MNSYEHHDSCRRNNRESSPPPCEEARDAHPLREYALSLVVFYSSILEPRGLGHLRMISSYGIC